MSEWMCEWLRLVIRVFEPLCLLYEHVICMCVYYWWPASPPLLSCIHMICFMIIFCRCCRRRRWRRVLQLHLLLRLCECDYLPHRHLRRSLFLLFLWGVAASNRPDVRRQSSWLYLSSTLLKANPNPTCLYDNIAAVMFVWKVYIDAGVL